MVAIFVLAQCVQRLYIISDEIGKFTTPELTIVQVQLAIQINGLYDRINWIYPVSRNAWLCIFFKCQSATCNVDTVSTFIQVPRMFLSMDILLEQQIEQFIIDLLHIRFICYTMDNIRSVPGIASDSPCSIRGRGWTTCLLYGGLLFRLMFLIVDV